MRLVHRTRPVIRTAGHAGFRRGHPAGANASLTRDYRESQEDDREPIGEALHPLRMRDRLWPVKSADPTPRGQLPLPVQPKDAYRHQDDERNPCRDDTVGDT